MKIDHDATPEAVHESMYEANNLKIIVNHTGLKGIFFSSPKVTCLNFRRNKLRFTSDRKFNLHQELVVDLSIGRVFLHELRAVVSTIVREDSSWCYSAEFCFDNPHMLSSSVIQALLTIEENLKTHENFPIN